MIKVEKKGNTTKATVEGNTYVLVDEFQTVLHALYQLLEKNIKESESVTPYGILCTQWWKMWCKRKGDRDKT
ncbi:MAG: hypothetical protein ACLTER_00100 [Ruminococcus sp.]